MTAFSGIWVPLATPFHRSEIDFAALRAIACHVAKAGVAGLVVCGSTGEAAALDENEQLAVLDAVLDAVPDCPVTMGVAGNNLTAVLARMKRIQARPVTGLLVPPPYYIRPSQACLVEYFRTLADQAAVPLIVYNIPYRTGVGFTLDTFKEIAQHEHIIAVKDCGGDLPLTMQLIAETKLQVLAGEDAQILSTICLGGTGAIAASAHIRPDLFARLAQCARSGELEQARAIFYRLLPLIRLLFQEPNPGPLKAALAMMGLARDELRSPMQKASIELRGALAIELKRLECV